MAPRRPRTSPPTAVPLDLDRTPAPMPDPPGKLHPSKGPYVPCEPGAPLLERIERVEAHLDGFPCPGCQGAVGLFGAWRRQLAKCTHPVVNTDGAGHFECAYCNANLSAAGGVQHDPDNPYEREADFIAALVYVMGRPGLVHQAEIIDAVGDLMGRAYPDGAPDQYPPIVPNDADRPAPVQTYTADAGPEVVADTAAAPESVQDWRNVACTCTPGVLYHQDDCATSIAYEAQKAGVGPAPNPRITPGTPCRDCGQYTHGGALNPDGRCDECREKVQPDDLPWE